ncbi:MAG: glycosyltransferase family 1 protein [Betaproteobacteria bacterium]
MDIPAPLRVGISATPTEGSAIPERPDGIGVYTRELTAAYALRDDVVPIPVVIGPRALRHAPPGALALPQRAAVSAAVSWATGAVAVGARQLARRIDVFHASDYRIPRLRGTPVCATLFDAIPLSHPEWANPRMRGPKNFLLRQSARWADHVLAISHAMVPELVEQYGIPAARISVTPLGVDARWFERESPQRVTAVCMRFDVARGYFLCVGTLQPRKNVERIIEAYRRLPARMQQERQLVIVGKAGWRAGELVKTLRALAVHGRVRWLDYVEADELRALYQGASAFVFPSLYEGFGLPMLEAFASGIPVVTSTTTSLPEVAGDAALLVDPTDTDDIAAAMARVMDDLALADRLKEAGLARARTYTWARCAEETVAVMRALL